MSHVGEGKHLSDHIKESLYKITTTTTDVLAIPEAC